MSSDSTGMLVEIRTKVGLAYALCTHIHKKPPRYGELLRVFDRMFLNRPQEMATVLMLPVRFSLFFPLRAAVGQKLVTPIGRVTVPRQLLIFPTFRAGFVDPFTRGISQWWLWDGTREWKVGALSTEQKKLSIRGIWNHELLVHRLERGWRPEDDDR